MKQTTPARSVTMEDVARDAGVSRALVSLVMRESPKVSPAKRAAVLESAAALGYSPNRLASRLASPRTRTLGVLFLDLHNSVFADIYDGITRGIAGSGNQVMVAVGSADPRTKLEAVRSFVDLRVDGVVLAGYTGSPQDLEAVLRGTPAVVITREVKADGVDSVLTDDFRSGALAVEHLHGLGHQRIAGCDNIEVAASPLIGLTSIDQHASELGRTAAQVMLERIAGLPGPGVTRKLDPVLMPRRSTIPVAAR